MKKENEKKVKTCILPEGSLHYTCCAECSAGEYDERKEMVYCGPTRKWRNPTFGCSSGPDR